MQHVGWRTGHIRRDVLCLLHLPGPTSLAADLQLGCIQNVPPGIFPGAPQLTLRCHNVWPICVHTTIHPLDHTNACLSKDPVGNCPESSSQPQEDADYKPVNEIKVW